MTFKCPLLVLGQTQFMGSEFGNFGGFRWVFCSVLVCELGFRRVWSLISRVGSNFNFEVFSKMFIVVGFVGSEFQILEGFGWICSSVLVGKPGFGRVWISTSRVQSSFKFSLKCFVVGFVGSEFGTFVGFGWILSSVLVDKPGFQKGLKQFEVRYFWVRPNTSMNLT